MSSVATIAIGTAVVGGVASNMASSSASRSTSRGATNAAAAERAGTERSIAEARRQYDYQQRILLPQIQQQYNAQRQYSDVLGIGGQDTTYFSSAPASGRNNGPAAGAGSGTNLQRLDNNVMAAPEPTARELEIQNRIAGIEQAFNTPGAFGNGGNQTAQRMQARQNELDGLRSELEQLSTARLEATPGATARMGGAGSSGVNAPGSRFRDPVTGAFVDPNLNPTRLADTSTYADTVEGNLLAGTSAEDDPFRQYLQGNRLATSNPNDSTMVRRTRDVTMTGARGNALTANGAAGRGVYGETFTESPGYGFQREEMERQLQRVGSAGGPNIGGRAIIEAQRRAQGLAAGDYYNWAAGRSRDLERLGDAEAFDAGRLDQFAGSDIQRGDIALSEWESQRIADVGRDDAGYENYLARRAGDVTRLDSAAMDTDRLVAADLQRQDQGYYNYLAALRDQAGFGGGPAATAINASARQGESVGNAYASSGARQSQIAGDLGMSQANIGYANAANINNAFQSGVSNYVTAREAGLGAPAAAQPASTRRRSANMRRV